MPWRPVRCPSFPQFPLPAAAAVSLRPRHPPSLTLLPRIAAPSVLAQLSARRDSQQKRVDSLLKLKNEFQELAKIL